MTSSSTTGREHGDLCPFWGRRFETPGHCWCLTDLDRSVTAYVTTDERGLLTAESTLAVTVDGVTHGGLLITQPGDEKYIGSTSIYEVVLLISRALADLGLNLRADFSAGAEALTFSTIYGPGEPYHYSFTATRQD